MIRFAPLFASVIGLVVVAVSARAQDAEGIDCANTVIQQEMNICANRDYAAADARLNRAYREAMTRLDTARRARLRADERNWIDKRDRECKNETADTEGGSLHPLDLAGCLTKKTNARIKELQAR